MIKFGFSFYLAQDTINEAVIEQQEYQKKVNFLPYVANLGENLIFEKKDTTIQV